MDAVLQVNTKNIKKMFFLFFTFFILLFILFMFYCKRTYFRLFVPRTFSISFLDLVHFHLSSFSTSPCCIWPLHNTWYIIISWGISCTFRERIITGTKGILPIRTSTSFEIGPGTLKCVDGLRLLFQGVSCIGTYV